MGFVDTIGLTAKITRPRTEAFLRRYATDKNVLDIGAGNDLYRSIFPNKKTLELNPRGDVDYVGNVEDMHMIPDETFDVVLLLGVLPHVKCPYKAVKEIHRILKKGGLLLFSSAFVYPINDHPGDYWRFTENGIRILFEDFTVETIEEQANTMETLAVLFQRIGFQCETRGGRWMKVWWFLLAKLFLACRGIIRKQYGDIGHKTVVSNIIASAYHAALRKEA
ncbi:MAG: class I SAM-dependent methyltransferase [Candidatus Peribacteraceae bacterium]|nr:class I SAM-dependent methyltransferase [Candidatus Peribacteraceae bacterium]